MRLMHWLAICRPDRVQKVRMTSETRSWLLHQPESNVWWDFGKDGDSFLGSPVEITRDGLDYHVWFVTADRTYSIGWTP